MGLGFCSFYRSPPTIHEPIKAGPVIKSSICRSYILPFLFSLCISVIPVVCGTSTSSAGKRNRRGELQITALGIESALPAHNVQRQGSGLLIYLSCIKEYEQDASGGIFLVEQRLFHAAGEQICGAAHLLCSAVNTLVQEFSLYHDGVIPTQISSPSIFL